MFKVAFLSLFFKLCEIEFIRKSSDSKSNYFFQWEGTFFWEKNGSIFVILSAFLWVFLYGFRRFLKFFCSFCKVLNNLWWATHFYVQVKFVRILKYWEKIGRIIAKKFAFPYFRILFCPTLVFFRGIIFHYRFFIKRHSLMRGHGSFSSPPRISTSFPQSTISMDSFSSSSSSMSISRSDKSASSDDKFNDSNDSFE